MEERETPILAYFHMLKDVCGIGMAEACRDLLSHETVHIGRRDIVPWDLANNETNRAPLTNTISKSRPGELPPETFADFTLQVPVLYSKVVEMRCERDELTSRDANHLLFAELTGHYADVMVDALEYTGVNADILDNARDGIIATKIGTTSDRALMAFMLLTITGCLGDPASAAFTTEAYGRHEFKASIFSELSSESAPRHELGGDSALGLQRVMTDGTRGRVHELDPAGTTIGTLPDPSLGSYIADVDNSVSNEHLRIWQQDGAWYMEALDTLNGTYVVRNMDIIVVDPPRHQREGFEYHDVELLPGDTIVMGSTSFEALYFTWGE